MAIAPVEISGEDSQANQVYLQSIRTKLESPKEWDSRHEQNPSNKSSDWWDLVDCARCGPLNPRPFLGPLMRA
ncbi:hypothetical protein MUK42_36814 [Musa troglodytarum]|uniref:Uncharacterized protein n=1 Tax=Musa troglodytarum TaxID=320322 RepID=A0A9E7EEN4_9LILI|nr:hypothetical protein MUK42_36814 [Musa troglodytarum]